MSIEPGTADFAARALVDWWRWGKCPTCLSERGEPCYALSGRVAGNRPDGLIRALERTHAGRKPWRR